MLPRRCLYLYLETQNQAYKVIIYEGLQPGAVPVSSQQCVFIARHASLVHSRGAHIADTAQAREACWLYGFISPLAAMLPVDSVD